MGPRGRTRVRVGAGLLIGFALASLLAVSPARSAPPGFREHRGPNGEVDVTVCSDEVPAGAARCFARKRTDEQARKTKPFRRGQRPAGPAAGVGNNGAYDPAYLQSAYNAPSGTAGAGQVVAIVDAYDNPNAYADMAAYRSFFGLPPCTIESGCFKKVNQSGGTSSYPPPDAGWAGEIALDLDMVSAMCPKCSIVLVEANSNWMSDLGAAVNTAVNMFHATVVSNSYGAGEWSGETSYSEWYYNHPGVAMVAASGDAGYGVWYPAASKYAVGVGGTSLYQNTNTGTRNGSETAWSGAGSGCSVYESKPAWQRDTGCARRTTTDVSAVADPATGVWVYNTYSAPGWQIFGGTSASAPIVGAMYAMASNPSSTDWPGNYPYTNVTTAPASLNDVTTGSNGTCSGSYLCTAVTGYDGPTGLGTPNGVAALTKPSTGPTVPGAPTNVSAVAGNAQASVSWTPPSSNGGSAITSYKVTAAPGGASSTVGGSANSATVAGLTNGTSYTFTVAATNGVGTGAASAPSNAVTPSTLPGPPTNVIASAGNAQASVSWTPPSSNGGSAITSYTVTAAPGGASSTVSGSVTSATVTGLTNGTSYTFSVIATNSAGAGAASAPSNAVTPATVPGAPLNVSAEPGNAQASVAWSAPSSNGGSAITSYKVTASPGGAISTVAGSVTSATVAGLTNGTTYTFTVTAANDVGTGAASAPSNAVTPATVPGPPTNVGATPGNARVTIAWSQPASSGGSAVTSYKVYRGTSSGAASFLTAVETGLSYTDTSVANGTAYYYRVTAVNGVGEGAASAEVSATPTAASSTTVPGAPQALNAAPANGKGISLSWSAPASNGGAPITGYQVLRSTSAGAETAYVSVSCTAASCSYKDSGTLRGRRYYYKVVAVNSVGAGPASNEASAIAR